MKVDNILMELQMITGIISDDPVFLYNEMLKGGNSGKESVKEEFIEIKDSYNVEANTDIDDWFSNL